MLIPITGTNFVRDTSSMALINKDTNGLEDYKMKRRMMVNQKDEINKIKIEMDSIKSDVSEIKSLIRQLLDKG